MMFAVPAGVGVRVESVSDDLAISAVGIPPKLLSSLALSAQSDPLFCSPAVRLLHASPAEEEAANYALSLLWIFARREGTRSEAMADFLRAALRTFSEVAHRREMELGAARVKSSKEITRTFLRHVAEHIRTERRVSVYAAWQFITSRHLSKMVKRELGEPPLVHIDRAVVAEAKGLLRDGRKTALQVSEELHFKNYSTFCDTFKRVEGVSPTEWRAARGMG